MTDTTDLGAPPKARVYCANVELGWFYCIERESPVGPFLSTIEAGRACREALIRRLRAEQAGDERAAAAREAAIKEARLAAQGNNAARTTFTDVAAAYLAGRLDAARDVHALAAKPGSTP